MKSIVEEASSIAKAVEKGWIRAGKPREFSVKIFEEPEKNFFGLTTKPAKIAIVFAQIAKVVSDKERFEKRPAAREQRYTEQAAPAPARQEPRQDQRQDRYQDRGEQQHSSRRDDTRQDRRYDRRRQDDRGPRNARDEGRQQSPQAAPQQQQQQAPQARQPHHESAKTWNDDVVTFSSQWLSECLALLGLPNVSINTSTSGNTLTVQLSSPVADNSKNERFFLSSLSHLLSEAIRGKFKLDMRSLRIMIHSN